MQVRVFDPQTVRRELEGLKGWQLNGQGQLERVFELPSFAHAALLAMAIAQVAEAADHHPDLLIQFRRITARVSTHAPKGLTERDFALARQIETLPQVALRPATNH